jgi:hypothetical protein
MTDLIHNGCYAIIQKFGGEHMRVCQIKKGQQILIEKLRFTPDLAIGKRFGLFEVSAGKLVEATYTPPQEGTLKFVFSNRFHFQRL